MKNFAAIDFETAEILALEYGKTLKKDSTRDETNFEELEIIDDEKDLHAALSLSRKIRVCMVLIIQLMII